MYRRRLFRRRYATSSDTQRRVPSRVSRLSPSTNSSEMDDPAMPVLYDSDSEFSHVSADVSRHVYT